MEIRKLVPTLDNSLDLVTVIPHGNGYLETWAYLQGAKSCLIEFPMPNSSSSITSNNYAGKLTNGLINMISNISGGSSTTEGGIVVNDLCQIKTTSSVNIRSGPGTSYSIVTSLTNGTKVTRIKRRLQLLMDILGIKFNFQMENWLCCYKLSGHSR